jgi:serine/threonine protein kinase
MGDWRMSQVAIKVVKPQSMSASQLEDFKAEIHIMKNMRPHPNLIQVRIFQEFSYVLATRWSNFRYC